MFSTWILHMVSFTLLVRGDINLCPFYEVTPGKESPLMDSLQCYNDYKTNVQCSWEVDPHVHPHATGNISLFELYYWDTSIKIKKTKCVPHRPGVLLPNGKISHECRYKSRRMGAGTNHTLFFNVPCTPRSTFLNVAQHGKVKAPVDLTEMEVNGGSHLLSWKSPYPASSNITSTLVYQLQYRRHKHDWTTVDNINASTYMIDKESLLPGYHYEAKVRARGPVGLWSDWSHPVSWKTHNDEVSGVYNLQCVIEGEKTVTCTWQMKTDYLQVMSYHLWCRDSNDAKFSACCEYPQLQSRDVELSEFMCSVTVSDPYLLTVELRPMQYSRMFKTHEHIRFPQPDKIQVMEEDGIFKMTWPVPDVKKVILYSTELKLLSHKDLVNITLEQGVNFFDIPSKNLSCSTEYQAQIRLLLIPDSEYIIPPSDWSEPAVFTTKPAASTSISPVIYILVPVFVAVLFIILYNALPVCYRRVKLWKGSVPSPIKSKVLEGIIKKSSTGWPHLQIEKETTSICVLLATDNISLCKSSVSQEPLLLHTEDVSVKAVKIGQSSGSNHLCTYVGEGMCKDKSGMNFSGPYILCCEDSCSRDKGLDGSTDRDHTSVLGKTESFAPINGGYVVTPPTAMPATQNPAPVDSPTNNPSDEPPAYTPGPDQGCMVVPHPSGYFMMPCVAMGQSEPRGSSGT
ncbi:hypothetical protein ABG768_019186 [Culter alburnus]|uniref:Fibronectin type-III domain-containing protein n=1 Tax=Culter alburnus TaxID=194366 RepID=A0AAW2AV18_CULAL